MIKITLNKLYTEWRSITDESFSAGLHLLDSDVSDRAGRAEPGHSHGVWSGEWGSRRPPTKKFPFSL